MGNPFNFSQGIQGESNDQIYNAQLAQMGQNDLARAQGLNQLSQRDLNAQLFGFKQDQYTNTNAGLTTEQQLVRANLAGVDAATMGQARDNRLQSAALYGKQDLQNNAQAFNKSNAIYSQTSTGTRINNYDGSQRLSALDKQTANKKAFDMRTAQEDKGKQEYSIQDMTDLRNYYSMTNEDGTVSASPYLKQMLGGSLQGQDIPQGTMDFVQKFVTTAAASRMPPAQIHSALADALARGVQYDQGGDGWFDSPSVSFSEPAALGTPPEVKMIGGKSYQKGNDGKIYEVDQAPQQQNVMQNAAQPASYAQPAQQQPAQQPVAQPQQLQEISQSMLENPNAWAAGRAVNGTIEVINKQIGRTFTIPYDAYQRMIGQPFASGVDQGANIAKSFVGGMLQ